MGVVSEVHDLLAFTKSSLSYISSGLLKLAISTIGELKFDKSALHKGLYFERENR